MDRPQCCVCKKFLTKHFTLYYKPYICQHCFKKQYELFEQRYGVNHYSQSETLRLFNQQITKHVNLKQIYKSYELIL